LLTNIEQEVFLSKKEKFFINKNTRCGRWFCDIRKFSSSQPASP